jgi:hypothetical protein
VADDQRQKEKVYKGAGGKRDEPNVEETGQSRLPRVGASYRRSRENFNGKVEGFSDSLTLNEA